MEKNALNWFEIPVNDFNRAQKFYSTIFDFDMQETVMNDVKMGFLKANIERGGIGGAIVQEESYKPSTNGIQVYLNANPNLSAVLDKVEKAGGKIITKKSIVTTDIGYIASFIDSEGNLINLHSLK